MVHMWLKLCFLALLASPLVCAQLQVTMGDALRAAVNKPPPAYSPIAKQMRVTGKVDVEVTIAADGSVDSVKVVTGNPLLTSTVVATVKKWKFTPFTLNGEPVKAIASLGFDFKP